MTLIYGLVFMAGLLTGGVWGWLVITQRHERVAAEHYQEELEAAEFQELYAAWAMLHRMQPRSRVSKKALP